MWRGQESITTFPSGRTTARSSTSSRACRSERSDVWRIRAGGRRARAADVPRLTRDLSNPAGRPDAAVPRHRRRWIRALDLRDGRRPPCAASHQHRRRGVRVARGECRWAARGRDRFTLDGPPVARADWRPRDRRIRCHANLAPDRTRSLAAGRGLDTSSIARRRAGMDGLWKLADGGAADRVVERPRRARRRRTRRSRPTANGSRFRCKDRDGRSCT